MQQSFTKEFIIANCGCYNDNGNISKLKTAYKENKNCSEESQCDVSLEEILDSNIPLKDKYWFVCNKLATKEQNQQIAIGIAEIVLDIYENKYPDDKAPREAIQAAKDYLANTGITLEQLREKRRAADAAADAAAYAAADAADAAYAAYAYAAAAAADAADAAADAADAAYAAYAAAAYAAAAAADAADAADAAAAYAAAPNYKNLLLTFLKEFCKNN